MKKYFILFILVPTTLFSIILKTPQSTLTIDLEASKLPSKEVAVQREREGKTIEETWKGIEIEEIINMEDYDEIIFRSADNYMIRLAQKQIQDNLVIVATSKNGELIASKEWRLIAPTLREMYWIKGLKEIEIVQKSYNLFPNTIYLGENYINYIGIKNSLPPYGKGQGIYFSNLYPDVFPIFNDKFTFVTKDGIIKKYAYEKYLKSAALIKLDSGYLLKSSDMPAGMWLKSLVYIQHDKRALVFQDQLKSWNELADLLDWKEIPEEMRFKPFGKNHSLKSLKDEKWQDILYFYW